MFYPALTSVVIKFKHNHYTGELCSYSPLGFISQTATVKCVKCQEIHISYFRLNECITRVHRSALRFLRIFNENALLTLFILHNGVE